MGITWPTKKLGEVIELHYGKGISKYDRKFDGKYPVYGANGILDYSDKYLIDADAIIVGRKGSAGEVTRVSGKFWPSDVTYYALGNVQVDIDYLFYALKNLNLQQFAIGVKPGINRNRIYELEIPLPPIGKQRKIVAKLEKVLEKIKEAKKLRKEAQTATDSLLAAELHKIFEEGKKKKWEEKELGKACDLYQGLAINAKSKHLLVKHSSLPLLRIKDLRENIEEQYVSEVGYPPDSLVNESDILYTRTGQVGLVFMGRHGILHNNCFKVIPRTGLDTKFLYWFLQEPKFKETIIRLSSRTAQPDITHKNFKIQKILIPPLTEQKKIVARLDALSNQIRILRQAQDQTASILYTLEQSVLHKAFNLT